MWSLHLVRGGSRTVSNAESEGQRERQAPSREERFRDEPKHLTPALLAGPLLGLLCIAVYAGAVGGRDAFGLGLAIALAAGMTGGLLGFLFAIPRNPGLPAGAGPVDRYRSNSNLEEISDWLTKILVGLGLVQFGRLMDGGRTLVDALASALGTTESGSATFAAALLVIFAVSGFLGAYIMTRVYLGPVFALSEQAMRSYLAQVQAQVQATEARLEVKAADIEEKAASVEERAASVEERAASVEEQAARVDEKAAQVDEQTAVVVEAIATMDDKVAASRGNPDEN